MHLACSTGRSTARASSSMSSKSSFRVLSQLTSSSLDNLGSHRGQAIRPAITSRRARLVLLPPSSPDANPIEQVFAKLKHLMRKASERTVDTAWQRIGTLLGSFSEQECANYFRNAGYASA